jgi:hypothetical protein
MNIGVLGMKQIFEVDQKLILCITIRLFLATHTFQNMGNFESCKKKNSIPPFYPNLYGS